MDKAFIAREESVATGEQIALQPTLAHVLAQDLHNATSSREVLISCDEWLHPLFRRDFIDRVKAIRGGLVGSEYAEVLGLAVQLEHITEEHAQYSR